MFSVLVASLNPCTASPFLSTIPCNVTRAHAIHAGEICIGSLGNLCSPKIRWLTHNGWRFCQINSEVSNQSGIEMSNRLGLMKGSFYIWTGWGGIWMKRAEMCQIRLTTVLRWWWKSLLSRWQLNDAQHIPPAGWVPPVAGLTPEGWAGPRRLQAPHGASPSGISSDRISYCISSAVWEFTLGCQYFLASLPLPLPIVWGDLQAGG